jgi:hypothetical protein
MSRVRALVDDALFGPETGARLAATQIVLSIAIAARVAITPFTRLTDAPDALVDMAPIVEWLPSMPSASAIVAVQVVGVAAGLLAAARRRPRVTYAVAWGCYLFLVALRASRGKVLHNDLMLLWASAVFLLAPVTASLHDDRPSRRHGWPIRTGIVVVSAIYVLAAYHKLRRSGPSWVYGENMSWLMYWLDWVGDSNAPGMTRWIADHHLAGSLMALSIIGFELTFPLVIVWRRIRPIVVAAALMLHAGTWLLLGLDYWMWAVTVAILLLDPSPVVRRVADWVRPRRRQVAST